MLGRKSSGSAQVVDDVQEVEDTLQAQPNGEELGKEESHAKLQELELEKVEISISGRTLTIVQPTDMDKVLDMYIDQDRLDRDPYWCRLWPAALALAEEIMSRPNLVKGRSVCDLGAGLGLGGMAAALAGAREVVLYDREPLALACALMTARANGVHVGTFGAFQQSLPFSDSLLTSLWSFSDPSGLKNDRVEGANALERGVKSNGVEDPSVYVGDDANEGGRENGGSRPMLRAELYNWSDENRSRAVFDVVLACDILYEKPSVPHVANILPGLMKDGAVSQAIISDPTDRCPGNRARFIQLLQGLETGQTLPHRKLTLVESSRRTPFMDGEMHNVEVLHFKEQK